MKKKISSFISVAIKTQYLYWAVQIQNHLNSNKTVDIFS